MKLILLASLLILIAAFLLRWWYGRRVLAIWGNHPCRCNLQKWLPPADDTRTVHRAEGTAGEFARELHGKAITDWKKDRSRASKGRENARRFTNLIPPLCMALAVLIVFTGRMPIMGVIAVGAAMTALGLFMSILSLPSELQAIRQEINTLREQKCFPNREDESAIIRCAMAYPWLDLLPAWLKWISRA
ncbi:MAG: hypothetical protein EAZ42_00040 [Verrucomicrobia bacterium]|nr:MAG: hypothetical protein EAZ42_00040 [Verrucomicrobiota bacterium]